MKKILLIPSYHYLSNPVYLSLKDILDEDYEFIYYFNKETVSLKGNLENISYDQIGKYFDRYIELDYDPLWVKRSNQKNISRLNSNTEEKKKLQTTHNLYRKCIHYIVKHPLSMYKLYKLYKEYNNYISTIVNTIHETSPDIIINNSDMTLTYRIIKKYFPNTKLIVLQPCFIDFRERELPKQGFKKFFFNFLLKGVIIPKQPYLGLSDISNKLLLFEDKFMEFYRNKRENIYRVYNPYFTILYENISILNKIAIKSKLPNYILDISKKPTVVLFVMNYISIHGIDVQKYTEDSYIKLIFDYQEDFNFIIKNHPRAPGIRLENELKSNPNVLFLSNEITYNELLLLGDLNISVNSNASLESLVAGMPTVNFLPLHLSENEHFKWLSYYCGLEAHTNEDLNRILNDFLIDRESFMGKVKDAKKMLLGSREQCRQSFLKVFD